METEQQALINRMTTADQRLGRLFTIKRVWEWIIRWQHKLPSEAVEDLRADLEPLQRDMPHH